MCNPVALGIGALATSVIGTGANIIQANKASKAQARASQQAEKDAAATKAANQRAINAANQKSPDIAALLGMNRTAQGGGIGSTMLTGPSGVPAGTMTLGKNTLLGR